MQAPFPGPTPWQTPFLTTGYPGDEDFPNIFLRTALQTICKPPIKQGKPQHPYSKGSVMRASFRDASLCVWGLNDLLFQGNFPSHKMHLKEAGSCTVAHMLTNKGHMKSRNWAGLHSTDIHFGIRLGGPNSACALGPLFWPRLLQCACPAAVRLTSLSEESDAVLLSRI